jgi:ribosomal-protein-alanine N-acetyltransferase
MTEADVDAVVALDPDARAKNLHEELKRAWARTRVLRIDGRIAGYALFWHVTDEIHLLNVAVDPADRRRGYGRQLVDEVITYARAHDAAKVLLEVRVSNVAAIGLYRALGFEEINRRKRYYDDGEDALEMMLVVLPKVAQTLIR